MPMASSLMAPLPPLPKLLPTKPGIGFPSPSRLPRAPVYSQYDVKPPLGASDPQSGFAASGAGVGETSRGDSFVVPPPKKRRRNVSGFLRKPRKSDCRGLVFHAACLGTRSSSKSYWCAECLRAEVPSSDRFVERSRIVVAVAERFIKTNKMFLGDYRCKRLMIEGRTHYVLASAEQAADVCDPSFEVEHAAPASMFAFDTNGVAFERMEHTDVDEAIVYHWSGKKKQFLAVPKPNSRNPSVRCTRSTCPNTGNRLCEHNLCSVHCFELQGITQGDDHDQYTAEQHRRRHKARHIKCSVHLPEKLCKIPVGRKFPTLSQRKGGGGASSHVTGLVHVVDLSSDSQSSATSFSSGSSSTDTDSASTSRRSSKRRRTNRLASSSYTSDESQDWSESSACTPPMKSEPFHLSRLMERSPSADLPSYLPPPLSFSNSSSSSSIRPIPSSSSSLLLPRLPPPLPLPRSLSSFKSPESSPAPPLSRTSGALPLALQLPPASIFSPEKTASAPLPSIRALPNPASNLPAPLPLPLPLPRQSTNKRKRPPPINLPRLPHAAADTAKRHKTSHFPPGSIRKHSVPKSPDSDSHEMPNTRASVGMKEEPGDTDGFVSETKTLRAFDFPQTILSTQRTPKSFDCDSAPPPMMDDGVVDDNMFEDFMKSLNDPEANAKVLKGREDADLSLLRGPLAALQSPPPPPMDDASSSRSLSAPKRERSSDDSTKGDVSLTLPLTPAAGDSDSANSDLFSSRHGASSLGDRLRVPASDDHGFSDEGDDEGGLVKFRSPSRSSSPPAREFQLLPFETFEPPSPFTSLFSTDPRHATAVSAADVSHPNFPDDDTAHVSSTEVNLSQHGCFDDGAQFLNALTHIPSQTISTPRASSATATKVEHSASAMKAFDPGSGCYAADSDAFMMMFGGGSKSPMMGMGLDAAPLSPWD